jgi:hypothetical protein
MQRCDQNPGPPTAETCGLPRRTDHIQLSKKDTAAPLSPTLDRENVA